MRVGLGLCLVSFTLASIYYCLFVCLFIYSLFIQVNSFNTNVLVSQEALIKLF